MNVVCLTGQLAEAPKTDMPLRPGWSSLLLRVPRHGLEGEEDAGVLSVLIALPPGLASAATHEHEIGRWVAVVGMLEVDVDYSAEIPRFHHAVVARSIERAAASVAT